MNYFCIFAPQMTKYNTITLKNGMRVIHLPSDAQVVYCGIAVKAGTRHERPGEEDGSIIPWNNNLEIVQELSERLNLAIVTPEEVYDNHIRQDNAGLNQRIVHGVSPGENIMVNSVVIGKTNSDKLTLIAKDNRIVD